MIMIMIILVAIIIVIIVIVVVVVDLDGDADAIFEASVGVDGGLSCDGVPALAHGDDRRVEGEVVSRLD